MVSATTTGRNAVSVRFLGALLLCGVCDLMIKAYDQEGRFLGALLLCGVCDATESKMYDRYVSRSSSALWCLRHEVTVSRRDALWGF